MNFLKSYLAPGRPKKELKTLEISAPLSEKEIEEAIAGTQVAPVKPHAPSGYINPYGGPKNKDQFPVGDFRNCSPEELLDIKSDVMVNFLYQQQMEMLWTAGGEDEGVVLKKTRGSYTCCPSDLLEEPWGFFRAIQTLNVRSAMTVNTRVIKLFLHNNDKPYVPLQDGLRLQVLPSISYIPRCQKHQFAAFVADRGILVVWDDEPRHLLARAESIEKGLMKMIWKEETEEGEEDDKEAVVDLTEDFDEEGNEIRKPRRVALQQPTMTGLTLALTCAAIGSGWRQIAQQIAIDGNYTRIAFAAVIPAQIWLGLFFFQAIIGCVAQMFGPIGQMTSNNKFYSGTAPKRLDRDDGPLPHVTVQMPVYKEGLMAVIQPTILSIKAAISTYEMQGGTANIFINDDGMQLIGEDEARARQDFYDEHNIGWVARPRHDPEGKHGEPFVRAGKFKKASNMNYAMWVSNRIEDKIANTWRPKNWTQEDEAGVYKNALMDVVEEDEGRTWADGNIRMGDYILIIDSDTRVPTDCFLDAVSEMEESPEVAILQYSSGVMNVTDSFFEAGITFFTNLVYTQIKFAVASGDVAPFVGHNAVLRWSAVQSIAYDCPIDKCEKFWSEATVSEDFDMALRLQNEGYLCRLGGYTGDGFKEGVSLTVYDELARWEKYAYGCNELLFHPLKDWLRHGPFTPLFKNFVMSGMPFPSKCTIMAYIGTYYAIGSAWILTFTNYLITGWFNGHLDHYYLDSFKVYFAIIVVFTALGNVALAVLRYRIEDMSLARAFWTNIKWIPLMTVFLGGISIHVSQALLSHMFNIDMSWGATSKEVENTTFWEEIPKVIKNFKYTFLFCIACAIMMALFATVLPWDWVINTFIAIYPLSTVILGHFLLPIVLNPNLMLFTW